MISWLNLRLCSLSSWPGILLGNQIGSKRTEFYLFLSGTTRIGAASFVKERRRRKEMFCDRKLRYEKKKCKNIVPPLFCVGGKLCSWHNDATNGLPLISTTFSRSLDNKSILTDGDNLWQTHKATFKLRWKSWAGIRFVWDLMTADLRGA